MVSDVLIFGAGSYARKLAKAFRAKGHTVHAFLSSHPAVHKHLDGIPWYGLDAVPETLQDAGPVACGVFNRSDDYQGLKNILHDYGFDQILWPWNYYPTLHRQLGWCYWMDAEPRDLLAWQQDTDYQTFVNLLADEQSRVIIERIIAFRFGLDLPFSAYKSVEPQYFNHLTLQALPTDRPISYLDVGAYNGDTLENLCAKAAVGTAILLEPDPCNFSQLIETASRLTQFYPQLQPSVLPMGAGSEYGFISMAVNGEASSLHASDQELAAESYTVTVIPIDHIMPALHIDFVKIDVEGHDREVIKGMQELLRRSMPVIVVSLYHRPRDLVDLSLYLRLVLRDLPYKFHVRQHLYNSYETVLYAIPEHRCASS
jgi:FkbM family methyltransferase